MAAAGAAKNSAQRILGTVLPAWELLREATQKLDLTSFFEADFHQKVNYVIGMTFEP